MDKLNSNVYKYMYYTCIFLSSGDFLRELEAKVANSEDFIEYIFLTTTSLHI